METGDLPLQDLEDEKEVEEEDQEEEDKELDLCTIIGCTNDFD